ncbi:MAG: EVE domain-containing protein [Cyanobacteria bacterium]|nr:EVE domain-containing protein [Cyanobacteria bacterium CG_2015-22_32_23]NCQ04175.1 EVE domain-containing protein [Cyanobacteria bacterium CG_2015-09_32_10]NCS85946.1 EVE domain-containing protein [Cyanobacteria bacterium CG_2015-02_32_10]
MKYWLMKSEPQVYSIEDLKRENTTVWDGVRNYQARNFLKQMEVGDLAFFYHSNCKNIGIIGLMEVIETNIIDPTQFDKSSPYFDVKSTINNPRWQTVKVQFKQKFPEIISLNTLKERFSGDEFLLVKKGNRLSVMPVPENLINLII